MIKNRKAKGTKNEHRSMRLFEKEGYRCTRSGASLGEFDFIGIRKEDIILVQVKTRDWPGTKEMQAIADFPAPPICRKLALRWMDRARRPDVRECTVGGWERLPCFWEGR